MPDELKQALSNNVAARRFFDPLPHSQKKQYIAWIASAKRPETRGKRPKDAVTLLETKKRLGMV